MKKLILLLLILSTPIVSAEETLLEESSEDAVLSQCGTAKWKDGVLSVVMNEGNVEVRYSQGEKTVDTFGPYVDGPESKCIKFKNFEKEKSFVIEMCRGLAGTQVMTERHSLLLFKVVDDKIKMIEAVDLKQTEYESSGSTITLDKTYSISRRDGKIVATIKDKKTKEQKEISF